MQTRRIILAVFLIACGVFLNWLSSVGFLCSSVTNSINTADQQKVVPSLVCGIIDLSLVRFGVTEIASALTAIGFVYLFLFNFIVEIFRTPIQELASKYFNQEEFARKMAVSRSLDTSAHRNLAVAHAVTSTEGILYEFDTFMLSLFKTMVDPAISDKKYWKISLNINVSLSEDEEVPEYLHFIDNTSYFVWCCAENGTYNAPIGTDYLIPQDRVKTFLLGKTYKVIVGTEVYEFSIREKDINYEQLVSGRVYIINEMRISFNNGLLSLNIDKSFPIVKGKNKVILIEQGYLHKSDCFFAYDLSTPCKGVSATIDLPRSYKIKDFAYSHMVLYGDETNSSPAISDNRHHFITDEWVVPGLLFALFWERNAASAAFRKTL